MILNIFFVFVFIIVSIILVFSSFLKLIELVVATIYLFKRGKKYRDRFFNEILSSSNKNIVEMVKIHKLDGDLPIQWPFVRKLILSFKHRKKNLISFLIKNYFIFIYRSPFLIGSLSILLIVFGFSVLAEDIQHNRICFIYIVTTSILIILLMFLEFIYDFIRRLYLGFVDNFREDFELNIVKTYSNQKYIKWSKSEFVFKNIRSIIILSVSFLWGFYALHCTIFLLNNNSFVFEVYPNKLSYLIQLAYFTIVTFATVGYGDIKPANLWAQATASFEIIFAIGIVILFLFTLSNTLSKN